MSRWHDFDPESVDLPQVPACYAIYVDGEVSYVGQTDNLAKRMSGHGIQPARYSALTETPWGAFRNVRGKYRVSQRYGDWAMVELRLLRRLRPRFNRRHIRRGVRGRP
jgi:excinuclease UvrABC nuclease subunit